ncbi:SH3 domain-containing protein [Devosia sp.]|uniref:SH3 domain-containing protein n=1 Tax=Devosia sp. TaxID=1871048 RepID=UPI002EEE5FCC
MKTSTIIATAALAAGMIFGTAAVADEATAWVNVRSGPGTSYRVLDTLHPGEQVTVRDCRSSGWCFVVRPGPDGWVSGRYLADSGATRRAPNVSFSFSFGRGDGFSIWTPPRGGSRDLVCLVTFFKRDQVAGGADANVQRARVLPRHEAERRDGPNDRQAIFDYGTNQQTRDTCRYLDRLN